MLVHDRTRTELAFALARCHIDLYGRRHMSLLNTRLMPMFSTTSSNLGTLTSNLSRLGGRNEDVILYYDSELFDERKGCLH